MSEMITRDEVSSRSNNNRDLRFYDKDNYKNKIFPTLSSALMQTNVSLAGKWDSHRHSTTKFSKNAVVVKASYQMLGILSFSNRERALPPSMEISELTFVVKKKYKEAFWGCLYYFREW